MAVTFEEDFAAEVADISTLPEFQNATIEIRDARLTTTVRDILAGSDASYQDSDSPVIWTGQARIANSRSSLNVGGSTSVDPNSYKAMVVQIPYDPSFGRVLRGWLVRVVDGGRNHVLEDYLFTVDSDVTSSHVAAITFHVTIDVEANPNWIDVLVPPTGGYGISGYGLEGYGS